MSEVEQELNLLKDFAEQRLRKGSFVYDKVQDLLAQASREHARHMQQSQPKSASSEPTTLALVISADHPAIRDPRTINVPVSLTLEQLKHRIEQEFAGSYAVERILVKRTGRAYGTWDGKTLTQCEIRNGDELVVSCKAAGELSAGLKGIARLSSSGVKANNNAEYLALALHSFMLDMEFICVVELPSTVPGFAPSLKELPKTTFVHSSWNSQPQQAAFMYKHKTVPGKQFQLSCVDMGETLMATVAQRGGDTQSMELLVGQYVQQSPDARQIANSEDLLESLQRLVFSLVPALRPKPAPPSPASAAPGHSAEGPAGSTHPPPPPAGAPIRSPVPGNVGGNDMDPFYGGVHIGGRGPGWGGGPAGGRGGGNLVGPDHPMFFPDYEGGGGFDGGFGDIGGLPQPRFDPFGPVLGPNQDIGGAGVGNVGFPGRGRGGGPGRGMGRGGRGGNFPGEPNNDHLRPPGW